MNAILGGLTEVTYGKKLLWGLLVTLGGTYPAATQAADATQAKWSASGAPSANSSAAENAQPASQGEILAQQAAQMGGGAQTIPSSVTIAPNGATTFSPAPAEAPSSTWKR